MDGVVDGAPTLEMIKVSQPDARMAVRKEIEVFEDFSFKEIDIEDTKLKRKLGRKGAAITGIQKSGDGMNKLINPISISGELKDMLFERAKKQENYVIYKEKS